MNPILILLLAVGAWMFLKGSVADQGASKEAPADANGMLATVLAPSLTDIGQLTQFFNAFTTAYGNAATPQAALRLSLYAIVTALKVAMLQKGAQPNADELLALAYAPSSGMGGIQQLPDAPADAQQAAYAALIDGQTNVGTIGTYMQSMATSVSSNNQLTQAQKKRLYAYLLAMKVKQMMLTMGNSFKSPAYFAIANMSNVPNGSANTILSYQ
jgi:hypothetical protein